MRHRAVKRFSIRLLFSWLLFLAAFPETAIAQPQAPDAYLWDGTPNSRSAPAAAGWPVIDIHESYGAGAGPGNTVLRSAVTAAGGSFPLVFHLASAVWSVDSDLVIPAHIALWVPSGAQLSVAPGKTLSIEGPIMAGGYRIFSGDGSIQIRSEHVNMKWFGADPLEPPANNTNYFNRAIRALPSAGGTIFLDDIGLYRIGPPLEFTTGNTSIRFAKGVVLQSTQIGYGIYIHGSDKYNRIGNIRLSGVTLDGAGRGSAGIVAFYCDGVILEDCEAGAFTSDGIALGGWGVDLGYGNRIFNCRGSSNGVFGIIAIGQHDLEIAGCHFQQSGDSDYDLKNCASFNFHGNISSTPREHGVNVRCSSNGSDVSGRIADNWVEGAGKVSFYIHHDTHHGLTGELYDIIVAGNQSHSPGWSDYSIQGSTGHPLAGLTFADNMGSGAGSHGVSMAYVEAATVSGNDIDGPRGEGVILSGVWNSTFYDNTVAWPGAGGRIRSCFDIQDAKDGLTFSIFNTFERNNLYKGAHTGFGFLEESNSDHNVFTANTFYGFNPLNSHRLLGPHSGISDSIIGAVPQSIGDSVAIQSLIYDPSRQSLTIVAISSHQPHVKLTAEGFGPLSWKSWKGFYRNTFYGVVNPPAAVTVKSSGNGSDVRAVPFP